MIHPALWSPMLARSAFHRHAQILHGGVSGPDMPCGSSTSACIRCMRQSRITLSFPGLHGETQKPMRRLPIAANERSLRSMKGWRGPVLALIAAMASPAAAQVVASPAIPFAIANPSPAPVPLADDGVVAFGDAQARMTIPVTIDTRGPWPFIVDTGAERTVVSRELAGVLGLVSGGDVRVTAMTGTTTVGTVVVPMLSVSTISHRTIAAPALETRNLGALGMIGLDALQGHSVAIDFDRARMTVRPSRAHPVHAAAADEIVVVAKSVYGQLIVTDAHWRGVRIAVIVDTGSPVSIGNHALLAAMTKPPLPLGPLSVVSATGQTLTANAYAIDRLAIGSVDVNNVRIAGFGRAAVSPFRPDGAASDDARHGHIAAVPRGADRFRQSRDTVRIAARHGAGRTVPRLGLSGCAALPIAL